MRLDEFEKIRPLAKQVVRALQDDVAPKGIGYRAGFDPDNLIEQVVLNNPTWYPDDIYFPGFYGCVNEEFPLEPHGHVALILEVTEGPLIHRVRYYGKNGFPASFLEAIGQEIPVGEGEVIATIDNRLLRGYAGHYWFTRRDANSLDYRTWKKIGDPTDLPSLPPG